MAGSFGVLAYWTPALATATLIAWLSHRSSLPAPIGWVPDDIPHALEYGFFALTLVFALTRGFERCRRTATRVGLAWLIASLYGITDEWHQSFVPGRDAALSDWIADTVGAGLMAALILLVWRRMAAPPARV